MAHRGVETPTIFVLNNYIKELVFSLKRQKLTLQKKKKEDETRHFGSFILI